MSGAARRIELPDRRILAYRDYGPESGAVVLSFHGGLSCSTEVAFAEPLCQQLGIRLVAPDRPGIGDSDPSPERTLLDWPRDVAELADRLGIERFAVLGWSAGGPYALACAFALPERVTRAGCAAGMAPLDGPEAISGLGLWADRLLFGLGRRAPRLAAALLAANRLRSHASVVRSLLATLAQTGDADLGIVASLAPLEISGPFFAALARGTLGTAHDYRLLTRPWGFDPGAIASDVWLWHGRSDGLLSWRHSERLARVLPRAHLRLLDDHGHFLPRRILPAMLRTVTGSLGRDPKT